MYHAHTMAAKNLLDIYTQRLRLYISGKFQAATVKPIYFTLEANQEPCIERYTTRKHEQHAAVMLICVIHNVSRPYWHKLIKQET